MAPDEVLDDFFDLMRTPSMQPILPSILGNPADGGGPGRAHKKRYQISELPGEVNRRSIWRILYGRENGGYGYVCRRLKESSRAG